MMRPLTFLQAASLMAFAISALAPDRIERWQVLALFGLATIEMIASRKQP